MTTTKHAFGIADAPVGADEAKTTGDNLRAIAGNRPPFAHDWQCIGFDPGTTDGDQTAVARLDGSHWIEVKP